MKFEIRREIEIYLRLLKLGDSTAERSEFHGGARLWWPETGGFAIAI